MESKVGSVLGGSPGEQEAAGRTYREAGFGDRFLHLPTLHPHSRKGTSVELCKSCSQHQPF